MQMQIYLDTDTNRDIDTYGEIMAKSEINQIPFESVQLIAEKYPRSKMAENCLLHH